MDKDDILGRDIGTAIAEAIFEHETWLAAWHRAALCGQSAAAAPAGQDDHLQCSFGRWFDHNSKSGMIAGRLFDDLGQLHRELHEAAAFLAGKLRDGEPIPHDEYDAFMDVATKFRKVAVRVRELQEMPDDADPVEDELSDLQCRLTMLSELEREWERAARGGSACGLIMVCPDGLDEIRGRFGQIGVDRVFAGLAARLYAHLRPYDSVFRHGRDEYLICIPEVDRRHVVSVAERLDELLSAEPVSLSDALETPVAARFGVALSDGRSSVQDTLDRASHAAQTAGTAAGQRVVLWSPALEN